MSIDVQQTYETAVAHHQAGRLHDAEQLYRRILAANPRHTDAMQMLGVVASQAGHRDMGVNLVRRAIELNPNCPAYFGNLGMILADAGKLDEAIAEYHRALKMFPDYPEAHCNLANALMRQGKSEAAEAEYRRAIALRPQYADAIQNLGNCLTRLGKLREATDFCRQAVALRPTSADTHRNLGDALLKQELFAEAEVEYRKALDLRPNFLEAMCNLGVVFKELRNTTSAINILRACLKLRPDYVDAMINLAAALTDARQNTEAIEVLQKAVALRPNSAEIHANLGIAMRNLHRLEEAQAATEEALRLNPNLPDTHNNLGRIFTSLGRYDDAMNCYLKALSLRPDLASAHWNLGLARLTAGDFRGGWPEYEWRWKVLDLGLWRRKFDQPMWDGSDLNNRRILIHSEQGFGDAIQFVRYLPMVADRGGKIVLQCPAPLHPLFAKLPGVVEIFETNADAPATDVHFPLLSLPRIFETTLETIPAEVPYLAVDPNRVKFWKSRLPAKGRKKIGLVWTGKRQHANDLNRSISLDLFAPLAEIPKAFFVSLQKSDDAKPAAPFEMADWTDELTDFAETAALVANLDLIITVDTAAAHLAGAMGKPAWVLIPFRPDWRWMVERDDSPWYPTMKLFRQEKIGDWSAPIEHIRELLSSPAKKPRKTAKTTKKPRKQ